MQAPQGIIFDLDGTLLDSMADIADAVEYALHQEGLPGHPEEAYRTFIGKGMEVLAARAAPQGTSAETLSRLLGIAKERYMRNWAVKTAPYPGVLELLGALVAMHMPLWVLSNKPHAFTVAMVQHFFPNTPFVEVCGQKEGVALKPSPDVPLAMAASQGIQPGAMWVVGDMLVDIETASAAGMVSVGVLWGLRPQEMAGADRVIKTPQDLLALF